ncbi:hypothetical protein SDC9_185590 [bioreactor metagenome]|uniref:Uncharacterized protein n=1 Tax=bioreactor metagenome TaxID=1076179 RepID=A0A645HGI6_9ZZZZ
MLQVDGRPQGGDFGEDGLVLQQADTEALQAMQARRFGGGLAAQHGQSGADRLIVDAAHQFAEIGHLPAAGAVGGDFLAFANSIENSLGDVDALQLADRQLDQFGTQVAQFVHRLLLLGFRGAASIFGEIFVLHVNQSEAV